MTTAEIRAYNAGVRAVLNIARRSVDAIAATSTRRGHEEFAVAALAELVDAGRALFVPLPGNRSREGQAP